MEASPGRRLADFGEAVLDTIDLRGHPGDSGACLNPRAPLLSHALTPTGFLVRSGRSAEESAMDGMSCTEDDAEALASAAELRVAEPRRERPTSSYLHLERRRGCTRDVWGSDACRSARPRVSWTCGDVRAMPGRLLVAQPRAHRAACRGLA